MVSKFTRTNSAVTCTRCSLALILILEYFTPEVHLSHVRLQVSALGEMARNEVKDFCSCWCLKPLRCLFLGW